MQSNWESPVVSVRMQNDSHFGKQSAVSSEARDALSVWSWNPTPGYLARRSESTCSGAHLCTQVKGSFGASLLQTDRCLSVDKGMNEWWYIGTKTCFLVLKRSCGNSHGWISKAWHEVKGARNKWLSTVWFHLQDILQKTKLYRRNTDQWLLRAGGRERIDHRGDKRSFRGDENVLYFDGVCICQILSKCSTRTLIFTLPN